MRRRAFLSSLILYIVPVGHNDFASTLWGGVLLRQPRDESFDQAVLTGYLCGTALLQAVLFMLLLALFRWSPRRRTAAMACVALFLTLGVPVSIGAIWLDSRLVPALHREADGPPIAWPEVCRVEKAHLLTPEGSRYAVLEVTGRAWLADHKKESPMLMSGGCELTSFLGPGEIHGFLHPREPSFNIDTIGTTFRGHHFQAAPSLSLAGRTGDVLTPTAYSFHRRDETGCLAFDFVRQIRFEIPEAREHRCRLLTHHVQVWESDAEHLLVSSAAGKHIARITIPPLHLRDVDPSAHRVLLTEAEYRPAAHTEIDFDGQIRWRLPKLAGDHHVTVLRNGTDWVALRRRTSHYIECCLDWEIAGKPGRHRVARGRIIVSVSLAPDGRHIALTVTDWHRTGQLADAVYVLRAADSREVFRHALPPLIRGAAQFVGPSLLAFTDTAHGNGVVRIMRVPD